MQDYLIAGRYRLQKEMAHVSEANYYDALDLNTVRPVAIRVIDLNQRGAVGIGMEELASRKLRLMAENEKQFIGQLKHPNVLEIIDHGFDGQIYYHVFHAFTFESLQTRLERNAHISMIDALDYMRQAAETLAYFHQKGIIHCDISAENLLIVENQIKIIEFSIANLQIAEGIASGNPPYMSPEAIAGARPAPARDVWALGVTMFYALTGAYPFGSLGSAGVQAVPALFKRILQDPPNIAGSRLPAKLTWLIGQMLKKDPVERITDMRKVAAEIEAVAHSLD